MEFPADGELQTFTVPFDYVKPTEVEVYIDGVQTTEFEFISSNMISLTEAPPAGVIVLIARTTDLTTRAVDFEAGAVLTEEDLDTAFQQVFNASQESTDLVEATMAKDYDGKWEGQNRVIKNLLPPEDLNDAVTLGYFSTNITAVTNVSANMTQVESVHENMADVLVVAEDLKLGTDVDENGDLDETTSSAINTVAASINDVNAYADTYYIGATSPNTSVEGAQWYNTTNNTKYIYNGATWQAYNTSVTSTFVGLRVTSDGTLTVDYGEGEFLTSDYDDWFIGLSDATFSIEEDGHLRVTY